MRLAKQDELREKKDAKIKQMAMQQKKKVEQAKMGVSMHSYSSGGFVGINNLAKGDGPKWIPGTKKQEVAAEEEEAHVITSDNEMFILGLLMSRGRRRRTGRGWTRY